MGPYSLGHVGQSEGLQSWGLQFPGPPILDLFMDTPGGYSLGAYSLGGYNLGHGFWVCLCTHPWLSVWRRTVWEPPAWDMSASLETYSLEAYNFPGHRFCSCLCTHPS